MAILTLSPESLSPGTFCVLFYNSKYVNLTSLFRKVDFNIVDDDIIISEVWEDNDVMTDKDDNNDWGEAYLS